MQSVQDGLLVAPGDYVHFKARVPLRQVWVGHKHWRYYDFGPKSVPPLVCLGDVCSTAEVFYKVIHSLSLKGYRVIAADAPAVWSHQEWVNSFEKFLDLIGVHHVHLYGTGLGGFLAQLFAQHRPRRVKSLLLSNTFLEAWSSSAAILISWAPEFILKRYILSGIRDGPQEPLIADSIDFVVSRVETLSRDELASRLRLSTSQAAVVQVPIHDSLVTIMDTNDYSSIPQALRDQVAARYPAARRAYLKSGGDFPFLSRAAEVCLYAQLHLRRVGVEAVAQALPSDSSSSSGDGQFQQENDNNNNSNSNVRDDQPSSSSSSLGFSPTSGERLSDLYKRSVQPACA